MWFKKEVDAFALKVCEDQWKPVAIFYTECTSLMESEFFKAATEQKNSAAMRTERPRFESPSFHV
jgi:hypothetical protein